MNLNHLRQSVPSNHLSNRIVVKTYLDLLTEFKLTDYSNDLLNQYWNMYVDFKSK